VLFGSDFPWWKPKAALEYVRATLDDAEAEQVLSRNAQDLMGLG
jgi:predicted TIM-barrel fold metal-dependent hydrolase